MHQRLIKILTALAWGLGAVGLTSLAPDPGRLGTLAAQGILELVRGKQTQSQKLPWKLVTRKST